MTLDLSYINEQPSEEQEKTVQRAVEFECLRAIVTYLTEVADAMDANQIETLNVPSLRAMAQELANRLPENGEN
jgi:hypothetical protein